MEDSIGSILKEAREERKLSLERASKDLRIRQIYLQELESNDAHEPYNVYKIGYLKNYATYLGVDLKDYLKSLKKHNINNHHKVDSKLDFNKTKPPFKIITLSLLLLIVTVSTIMYFTNKDKNQPEAAKPQGISINLDNDKFTIFQDHKNRSILAITAKDKTKLRLETPEGILIKEIILEPNKSEILPTDTNLVAIPSNKEEIEFYEFSGITMQKKKIEVIKKSTD